MASAVQCMFYVASVTEQANGAGIVKMNAVAKGPYAEWSQWTPSGSFEITSLNADATAFFREFLGKDVAILITPPEPVKDES